jgi:DNA-binding transcriptional MocR family regulator
MIPQPILDPNSEVPLYRQLHRYYTELIDSGTLATGERLPATRELAGLLGLNRTTVSAAYELLEADGLITAQVGRGSFVSGGHTTQRRSLDWDTLIERQLPSTPPSLGRAAISFATSRPAEQLFPVTDLRASCDEVLEGSELLQILQLGSPAGFEPLRQYLLREGHRQAAVKPGDDLMITSGCQQALDLLARALLRPGDKVALEDPVYPGLKNLLAQAGAQLLGIPVGPEGLDIEHLERTMRRERPKLLVATPDFQNPTGATLPLEARVELLRLAREHGVVVVENDIYGDLRYAGDPLPSLKQLDDTGHVILLRSFSKIAFPGLRVGWVAGPRAPVTRLVQAKQLCDLHTDQFSQAVLLRFAESGRLAAHRTRMRETGGERLQAALAACERYLPRGTHYTTPQGGMNLWVRLPDPLDAADLLPRAQREGVSYLPGKYFTVSRSEPGGLRLSFAGLAPEEISKGIAILGEVCGRELERTRSVEPLEPAQAVV